MDGLNLTRTIEPDKVQNFCDLLVLVLVLGLQNRGAFKTGYADGPLREKQFPGTGGREKSTHPAARARALAA